ERPARRRGEHGRVRTARQIEVDPRGADRARKDVERNASDQARTSRVTAEVAAAEREVDVLQPSARLPDERAHPLAAELVAVAVEEDVVLLLDVHRHEELRIDAPEDGLNAPCTELLQAGGAAFRVADDEVVLAWIGPVVVVETGVHAAELRPAHRNVAVVID